MIGTEADVVRVSGSIHAVPFHFRLIQGHRWWDADVLNEDAGAHRLYWLSQTLVCSLDTFEIVDSNTPS